MQCIRAYQLHKQGMTNRQIADLVGRKVSAIPEMVKVGERFSDGPLIGTEIV